MLNIYKYMLKHLKEPFLNNKANCMSIQKYAKEIKDIIVFTCIERRKITWSLPKATCRV